jgi:peptide chain release factor 1
VQRVPPNEKRGRRQTSTIAVVVLQQEDTSSQKVFIRQDDLEIFTCRGSGAGGQHRNVTDSAVQINHKPTGISVKCEGERSQHKNRTHAMKMLHERLSRHASEKLHQARNAIRQEHHGNGARSEKRRTVLFQHGVVKDHVDGRTWNLREYLSGEWK